MFDGCLDPSLSLCILLEEMPNGTKLVIASNEAIHHSFGLPQKFGDWE